MGTVEIDDPLEHRTNKKVDDRGRVTVGNEHSGKTVNVVVEEVEDEAVDGCHGGTEMSVAEGLCSDCIEFYQNYEVGGSDD